MNFTKTLKLLGAALLLSSASLTAEYKPIQMEKGDKEIAQYVTRIMEVYHYSKIKFDNDLSNKIFDEFFNYLDHNRYIFLKEDVEEFSIYKNLLDDMYKRGDLTFSVKLYNRYMQRLEERTEFIRQRLKEPFDFTVKEDMLLERDKVEWVESKEGLNEVWRKHLKNNILSMEMAEILNKEKLAESKKKIEKKDTKKPIKKKNVLTPQDRLLKRYNTFLKYQSENDHGNLLEIALNAMTKCLDPHSNYFGAKAQEEFEISMKLSLTGIGATLQFDDGYTKIVSLVPGGPAHKSKQLEAGDRITAVGQDEDEPVDVIDMRLSKVVSMVRGKKGSIVTLHIVRGGVNGEPHIVKITRDKIKLQDSEAKGEVVEVKDNTGNDKKVGVIHLPSFYVDWDAIREGREGKSSTADVKKILQKQMKEGIDSLIIDLRNNGGGSLPEAISLTGLFIDKGPVVQIREGSGRVEVRNDEDAGALYKGSLVVLVNEGSASASEIFAAALQDYKRCVVVGTYRTHGKGTVQQVQALSRLRAFSNRQDIKPGQVKYTMAKFYRINGGSTQKKGVTPDIILPSYAEQNDQGEATLKHVLPWDEIGNLKVDQNSDIKNMIPQLKKRSAERISKDEDFIAFNKDLKFFAEKLAQKTISLNKAQRLEVFKQDRLVRKERKVLLKRIFDQSDKEDENASSSSKIRKDVYFREALKVLNDLEELLKAQASK